MKNRLVSLAAGLLSIAPLAANAAIFYDFETPIACGTAAQNYCLRAPFSTFDGVTVNAGNIDVVGAFTAGGFGWQANTGTQSLDLVGTTPGGIQLVFATVAGQQYDVSFFYSRNPNGSPNTSNFAVGVNGDATPLVVEVGGAPTRNAMNWQQGTYSFTATGASSSVNFLALNGATQGGATLDSISIAAVPEASEVAMMAMGLGFVGWVARRRRSARPVPAAA